MNDKILIVAAGLLCALSPITEAQLFEVTDLGVLPTGRDSWAYGLNDQGQVVGTSTVGGTSTTHAFLWQNGVLTDLGVLPCGQQSWAVDINEAGLIAGDSEVCFSLSPGRRIFTSDGSTLTDLQFGQTRTYARDIDEQGRIVGTIDTGALIDFRPVTHAVFWNGQSDVDLGTLGGTFSRANALNESTQIVGGSGVSRNGGYHAFLWENGTMVDLGTLGGRNSEALDIDGRGRIVGWADDASRTRRAFLLASGQMQDLGELGGGSSEAWSIASTGRIVGVAPNAEGRPRAFLFDPRRSGLIDLNDRVSTSSPWTLVQAADINSRGDIVGWAADGAGAQRAVLLTKAPVELSDPSPGQAGQSNRFDLTGATPGELVHLVFGLQAGTTPVPGCPGLDLDISGVGIAQVARADREGNVRFDVSIPALASGRTVLFQAVDWSGCSVSPLVSVRFP
ncbi:MAG: hypothetical protein RL885_21485 [Planctomycetota bacterium]